MKHLAMRRRPFIPTALSRAAATLALTSLWLATAAGAQEITWVHTLKGNQPAGLDGAVDVGLSPDGRSLYAVATVSNSLVEFRRDPATGASTAGVSHGRAELAGAAAVVVDEAGENVYVAAIAADAVSHWSRDPVDGSLTFVGTAPAPAMAAALDGPTALALDPDGTTLWAVGINDDRIFRYLRASDGTLAFDGAWGLGVAGARDLAVNADGSRLFVTDLQGDALVMAGTSQQFVLPLQTLQQGIGGADGLDSPYLLELSPDGEDLYVTALAGDTVTHFSVAGNGTLSKLQVYRNGVAGTSGLDGALGLGLSEDGSQLFVSAEASNALLRFARDPATGALQHLETVPSSALQSPLALLGAAGLVVRGGTVSVTALAGEAVSVFRFGPHGLSFPREPDSRGPVPGALAHVQTSRSPTFLGGRNLAAALAGSPWVHVFSRDSCGGQCVRYVPAPRDPESGALSSPPFRSTLDPVDLTQLSALGWSPDGAHVYVASSSEDSLVVAEAQVGNAGLDFVQLLVDGVAGVAGLDEPREVAVSPDGAHVYVADRESDGIGRFARDPATGVLTFLGLTVALGSPSPALHGLTFSPDGLSLYLLDLAGRIHAYSRNPATGDLQLTETEAFNGDPRQAVVSADGRHLYVTSHLPGRLYGFARNPATGALSPNSTSSVPGMPAPDAIAFADSGRTLLVGDGTAGDAAVYRRNGLDGLLTYDGSLAADPSLAADLLGHRRFTPTPDGKSVLVSSMNSRVVVLGTGLLFRDGFESGDISAWDTALLP